MTACFTCSKDGATLECAAVVMELQGFANLADDRKTIVQVVCQLLRVQWKSIEGVLTKKSGKFLFCVPCFKAMTEIIILREKLFQIETKIRQKLRNIEESLATSWVEFADIYDKKFAEEFEPDTHEDFRVIFQRQAMQEIWNKHLIQKKILELNQTSKTFSVETAPSMVQLQLEKNVFDIVDDPDPVEMKPLLDIFDNIKPHSKSGFPLTLDSNRDTEDEFSLICVSHKDLESSEDVSPRKKPRSEDVGSQHPSNTTAQNIFTGNSFTANKNISGNSNGGDRPRKAMLEKHYTPVAESSVILKTSAQNISRDFRERDSDDNGNEDDDESWIEDSDDAAGDFEKASGDSQGSNDESSNDSNDDDGEDQNSKDKTGSEEKTEPEISISELCKKHKFEPKYSRTNGQQKLTSVQLEQVHATFIGKDKTKWTTQAPNHRRQTRAYEVLRQDGGLIGPAQNTKLTPVELFKLMLPPSIIETIVNHTNTYAALIEKPAATSNNMRWYPTTVDEMYAFIGILLYVGVEKKRSKIHEMWTKDEKYAVPAIVATMCKNRFFRILRYLKFHDTVSLKASTESKWKHDDAESEDYISEFLNAFIEVMQSHLRPYETLVVDEMMVKFLGRSKFKSNINSKPGTDLYGLKFWGVCDVKTGYILKIAIYHGNMAKKVTKDLGNKVVLELVNKYFYAGRSVTMGNFFTSKALGEELIKKKMSMLGILTNKMDIISAFSSPKGRESRSSIFAFQEDFTMVSYFQKRKKGFIHLLLSTNHHLPEICPDMKQKPLMLLDYNANNSVIDTADRMIANYSCQRLIVRRWHIKVFYTLLDIAALNAYIVHKLHGSLDQSHQQSKDRKCFLRNICESLMEPMIAIRATSRIIPFAGSTYEVLAKLACEQGKITEQTRTAGQQDVNTKRVRPRRVSFKAVRLCVTCRIDKKEKNCRTACYKCLQPICRTHQNETILCDVCECLR